MVVMGVQTTLEFFFNPFLCMLGFRKDIHFFVKIKKSIIFVSLFGISFYFLFFIFIFTT